MPTRSKKDNQSEFSMGHVQTLHEDFLRSRRMLHHKEQLPSLARELNENLARLAAISATSRSTSPSSPTKHRSRFERKRLGQLIADVVLNISSVCQAADVSIPDEEHYFRQQSLLTPKEEEETPFLHFDQVDDPDSEIDLSNPDVEQRRARRRSSNGGSLSAGNLTGPGIPPRSNPVSSTSGLPRSRTNSIQNNSTSTCTRSRSTSQSRAFSANSMVCVGSGNIPVQNDSLTSSIKLKFAYSTSTIGSKGAGSPLMSIAGQGRLMVDKKKLSEFYDLVMALNSNDFSVMEFETLGLKYCIPKVAAHFYQGSGSFNLCSAQQHQIHQSLHSQVASNPMSIRTTPSAQGSIPDNMAGNSLQNFSLGPAMMKNLQQPSIASPKLVLSTETGGSSMREAVENTSLRSSIVGDVPLIHFMSATPTFNGYVDLIPDGHNVSVMRQDVAVFQQLVKEKIRELEITIPKNPSDEALAH